MKYLLNIFKRTRSKTKINKFDEVYFDNLSNRMQILKYKMDNHKQTNNK